MSVKHSAAALCGLLIAATLTPVAFAQDAHDTHEAGHEGHKSGGTGAATPAPQAELSAASKEYEAAMHRMHKDMAIPYTNNVDVDFVRGMIPHHQGAIEQAQVLLKYSKNPRLRRLAGGIIAAQRREIRFMQSWLKEQEGGKEGEDMPDWLKNTPVPSAEETTETTPKP